VEREGHGTRPCSPSQDSPVRPGSPFRGPLLSLSSNLRHGSGFSADWTEKSVQHVHLGSYVPQMTLSRSVSKFMKLQEPVRKVAPEYCTNWYMGDPRNSSLWWESRGRGGRCLSRGAQTARARGSLHRARPPWVRRRAPDEGSHLRIPTSMERQLRSVLRCTGSSPHPPSRQLSTGQATPTHRVARGRGQSTGASPHCARARQPRVWRFSMRPWNLE
jgi:hypothetical protein